MVKKIIIFIYTSQRGALLHRATEVFSLAGLVLVAQMLSLDLLTAAKWLYQSLLPSPEPSGEGAAFPEVSDGKTWCVRMIQKGSPQTLRGLEAQTPPGLGIEDDGNNLI